MTKNKKNLIGISQQDDHLYKTIKFDYDIPKMPPKPVDGQQRDATDPQQSNLQQRVSPNRAEFQLKYQEIKEQLASQLKQQKGGLGANDRAQRTNSVISPQRKFGRFMNMFRSATGSTSPPPMQEPFAKKLSPEKTAKIMKYKRNTAIFSSEYEIVG